jgi:hypothetical protein
MVAQADEYQSTEIPAAIDPATKLDSLVRQLLVYFATKMCAHFLCSR